MLKKLIPGLVIALGVALIAGGAALAFGGGGGTPSNDLLAKVAEKLGLEPSVVQDAFSQAERSQTDDQVSQWLDKLVSDGTITQDQADQALTWFKSRPDSASNIGILGLPGIGFGRGFGFIGPRHFPNGANQFTLPDSLKQKLANALGVDPNTLAQAFSDAASQEAQTARIDAIKGFIDKLVQNGKLTADQGTQLKAWIDDMPGWMASGQFAPPIFGGGFGPGVPQMNGQAPRGFVWPNRGGPGFRFEIRPHGFQFGPAVPGTPSTPTPTPEAGNTSTGVLRPA